MRGPSGAKHGGLKGRAPESQIKGDKSSSIRAKRLSQKLFKKGNDPSERPKGVN